MPKIQNFHYDFDGTAYDIAVKVNRLTGGVHMTINADQYRLPGKIFGSRKRQDVFMLGEQRAILTVAHGVAEVSLVGE